MPKLIIGLVGRQGSGKGTVAKILQETYSATLYRFSGILGDILDRISIPKSRDNFVKISEALRHAFGEDVLAYAVEKEITSSDAEIIVVDGIRRPEDIVALEPLPQFTLVNVSVPPKTRFERMKGRGEKAGETTMTWEDFLRVENTAPTEITIPLVEARAQTTIDNSGTEDDLRKKIEELVTALREKKHA